MVGKNLIISLERARAIISAIEALKPNDRIVVLWHDASRVTNDPDVRAEYYSTPKETQGTVYDCKPDSEYPDSFYLIVCGETTGGKPDYYDSIPIGWIVKIEKLEISAVKHPKKEGKLATDLYTVKRMMLFKGGRMEQDNGGISKLPMKWARAGMATRKFVEEIEKVIA